VLLDRLENDILVLLLLQDLPEGILLEVYISSMLAKSRITHLADRRLIDGHPPFTDK
jgi:hypothetical protein